MRIATSDQMREIDRRAIEEFHLPAVLLSENAACRVTEFLADRFGPLRDRPIAVVCGKGRNGGDGLAIARHLELRFRARVTVWLATDSSAYQGPAAAALERAAACGLKLRSAKELDLSGACLVVDALFGTGLRGPVTGEAARIIQVMNQSGKTVVAVDLPSGLNADSGDALGAVVRAAATVTLSLPKFGLLEFPGAEFAGELIVADICIPRALTEVSSLRAHWTAADDVARWLPERRNGRDVNKGSFGQVAIFAGSAGFAGAPVLVAEAAARSGAGLVRLAVPRELQAPIMASLSPAIVTVGLPQSVDGAFAEDALEAGLSLVGRSSAVALGPGIGLGGATARFLREFVARCTAPLVLDADALTLLAREPDGGGALLKRRTAATILTPHPGEMGRLLGIATRAVQENRRAALAQACAKFGCVVLLKGARTLIGDPDGGLHLNSTGNPGLASGGTGDVLTGVITALLAQKLEPMQAAAAGAFLHGAAGDLAAAGQGGPTGLIATDLIGELPQAIAQLRRVRV